MKLLKMSALLLAALLMSPAVRASTYYKVNNVEIYVKAPSEAEGNEFAAIVYESNKQYHTGLFRLMPYSAGKAWIPLHLNRQDQMLTQRFDYNSDQYLAVYLSQMNGNNLVLNPTEFGKKLGCSYAISAAARSGKNWARLEEMKAGYEQGSGGFFAPKKRFSVRPVWEKGWVLEEGMDGHTGIRDPNSFTGLNFLLEEAFAGIGVLRSKNFDSQSFDGVKLTYQSRGVLINITERGNSKLHWVNMPADGQAACAFATYVMEAR